MKMAAHSKFVSGRSAVNLGLSTVVLSFVGIVGGAGVSGADSGSTQSTPPAAGILDTSTWGPTSVTAAPTTATSTTPNVGIFSCILDVSPVNWTSSTQYGSLDAYGTQSCSGSYAPQRVGISIWKIRWYGGQMISGTNWSAWSAGSQVIATTHYKCVGNNNTWTFYAVGTGEAEDGAYQDVLEGTDHVRTWACS
jgi:hypothetical protein